MKTKPIFMWIVMFLLMSCETSQNLPTPTPNITLTSIYKPTIYSTYLPVSTKITPSNDPTITPTPLADCVYWSHQDKAQTYDIAFNPDGDLFVSAGTQGIELFEITSGQFITNTRPMKIGSCPVRSVAFSPDGEILAAGSCGRRNNNGVCQQGRITLKDWKNYQTRLVLSGHDSEVVDIEFAPKGDILVSLSVGREQNIILWSTINGKPIANLSTISPYRSGFGLSVNGEILAYGDFDNIILFDIVANTEIVRLDHNLFGVFWNGSIAFSSDGKLLASGSCGKIDFEACIRGKINIWDMETMQRLWSVEAHDDSISAITFSPNGHFLASGSENQIQLWNIITGEHVRTFDTYKGEIYNLEFSPNGEQIIVAGQAEPVILNIGNP